MQSTASPAIRSAIEAILAARGRHEPIGDDESLFVSGRLDSLAATEVMMMLEADFAIDLADADFDMSRLDSISELSLLVGEKAAA